LGVFGKGEMCYDIIRRGIGKTTLVLCCMSGVVALVRGYGDLRLAAQAPRMQNRIGSGQKRRGPKGRGIDELQDSRIDV
jgi:hypothetical protein